MQKNRRNNASAGLHLHEGCKEKIKETLAEAREQKGESKLFIITVEECPSLAYGAKLEIS